MYRGWYRALLGGSRVLLGGSWPALEASARSWTALEIGRAARRGRVEISVGAGSLKKKDS